MLPWCLNPWPCGKGACGAWDNAVTACSSSSVLCPQSQLGWDGMKVLALSKLGLLPAAPSLACPQPWLQGALQVHTPALCPPGLWGPLLSSAQLCCPPAQPPHSSGALERHMRRGDPRARSTEPTLSPNSARLGTGQPQPPVPQLVWPSGTPHTPLERASPTVPSEATATSALGALGRCVLPRRPMVLTSPTSPSVRQPPAAAGAGQPGPFPRGSPGISSPRWLGR